MRRALQNLSIRLPSLRLASASLLVAAAAVGIAPNLAWADTSVVPAPASLESDPAGARAFHCDGTDPALFQEMQEAGWVGYGETWDLHTCDQGSAVFAPSATRRWRAFRSAAAAQRKAQEEASFWAMLFPFVAIGILGALFAAAWLLAVLLRRRWEPKLSLVCSACAVEIPVDADDPAMRNQFCPSCGGACRVIPRGAGYGTAPATPVA